MMYYIERTDTGKVWNKEGERWTYTTAGMRMSERDARHWYDVLTEQGYEVAILDSDLTPVNLPAY